MIDFQNLQVNRLIMHNIIAREPNRDHASTEYENSLLEIDLNVANTIRKRLSEALGRETRSFDLELENCEDDSFFGYCKNLHRENNGIFIRNSKWVADLLAEKQTRTTIPGGYLIFIQGTESVTNQILFIVIKAELHEALKFKKEGNTSQIELLQEVFLSPSQKLFKIGILKDNSDNDEQQTKTRYSCLLFDDQFRNEGRPAEYFYKDFLGFSVENNSKIQSQRFFDKTENFIKHNFDDYNTKQNLLNALKLEFTINQNNSVQPIEFAQTYFGDDDIIDKYNEDVASELPGSIVKSDVLISAKLRKKKIDFPENINITGPNLDFDQRVTIINNQNLLDTLNPSDNSYTIVKILGRPFSGNE